MLSTSRPATRHGGAGSSRLNRVDVLWHNLHGRLRPSTRAANAYLVPDVIPLAVNYGVPGLSTNTSLFYEAAARNGDVVIVFTNHAKKDFLERVGGSPESIRVAHLAAGRRTGRCAIVPVFAKRWRRRDLPTFLMSDGGDCGAQEEPCGSAQGISQQLLKKERALPHKLVLVGGKWIGHEAVFDLDPPAGTGEPRSTPVSRISSLRSMQGPTPSSIRPSTKDSGLAVLEAMASGVPVLAADATSLPEVAGNAGGHRFLRMASIGCADALREIIYGSRYSTSKCTRAGLERAATFSWRRTAVELYVEAFGSRAAARGAEACRKASSRPGASSPGLDCQRTVGPAPPRGDRGAIEELRRAGQQTPPAPVILQAPRIHPAPAAVHRFAPQRA